MLPTTHIIRYNCFVAFEKLRFFFMLQENTFCLIGDREGKIMMLTADPKKRKRWDV